MSLFTNVLERIDLGKVGGTVGLDHGLNRLREYLPNIQRGNTYLLGGESGSGKSSFTLNTFLYNPYDDFRKNHSDYKLKVFYWSLEMDKHVVLTKAICRRIYLDHNVLVDVNHVLSRGKNRISNSVYNLVLQYRKYFEDFEDRVTVLENSNPTGMNLLIKKYMLDNGKEIIHPLEITHKDGSIETIPKFDRYVPDNPNTYVICIIDHVGIIKGEQNLTKKGVIDKLMEYTIYLRDRYNVTPVLIQQLNRNLSATDRLKAGENISVNLSDFKESSDSIDGSNYVLSLFSPVRYDLNMYKGYNTGVLKNRFLALKINKSRDGEADKIIGLKHIGECGYFEELPLPNDLSPEDYTKISNIKKYTNYE